MTNIVGRPPVLRRSLATSPATLTRRWALLPGRPESDRRYSALGKVGGMQTAYIKKPHGLAIPRAVFTLSGSDAALLAARTAREQWREPPPFCFVRLFFVESREKDK